MRTSGGCPCSSVSRWRRARAQLAASSVFPVPVGRVIVCTRRPAMIALEQKISLPRPRDVLNVRFTPEFKELYDTLWERLRVEYQEERV